MAENDLQSPQPFVVARQKWEQWLKERIAARNLAEPMLIYVDDEAEQRSNRYYEARLQKFPGRNILLFENAAEAVEFLKFAKEKKLYIGSVISDYDNGSVSKTTGADVMAAAIDYNAGPDQGWDHAVVKLVISSEDRTRILSKSPNFSPFLDENIGLPDKFSFLHKNEGHYIEKAIQAVPNDKKEDLEHTALIPDLIFSMGIIETLIDRFRNVLKPYQKMVPPNHQEDPTLTIGEIYGDTLKTLKKSARRMEDMIKIWVMLIDHELKAEQSLGKFVPNPGSNEPEEPINIRILGTHFLRELKDIQQKLDRCFRMADLATFTPVTSLIQADTSISNPDERIIKANHVAHNLKGPLHTIIREINKLAGTSRHNGLIEQFMASERESIIMHPPQPDEHRFDHDALITMTKQYLKSRKLKPNETRETPPLRFFYLEVKHLKPPLPGEEERFTRDRNENTPGMPAPIRKTIGIPHTPDEAVNLIPVKPIKKSMLKRFLEVIVADSFVCQAATSAGNHHISLAEMARMLKEELEHEWRRK